MKQAEALRDGDSTRSSARADDQAALRVESAVRRWRGRVESDDHIFRDPGVTVALEPTAGEPVRTDGPRFACVVRAKVHDLDTWIETYAAKVTGRLTVDGAVIDGVEILAFAA